MIGPSGTVRVMLAIKPVDFRKGADGLATLVREDMMADPFSGAVYLFRAKRADRIELMGWDRPVPVCEAPGRRRLRCQRVKMACCVCRRAIIGAAGRA